MKGECNQTYRKAISSWRKCIFWINKGARSDETLKGIVLAGSADMAGANFSWIFKRRTHFEVDYGQN